MENLENVDLEQVIHPKHYTKEGKKECWDEMIDIFGPEAVAIWDALTAYKYFYRAGSKNENSQEQDLAKMRAYIDHLEGLREKYRADVVSKELSSECYWHLRETIGDI